MGTTSAYGSGTGRGLAAAALLAALQPLGASAGQADLYAGTVIVTGRDNLAERARGIREAFPLVLKKLTADAGVAARALDGGLAGDAEAAVERLDYRDRKEGIQISDEQGTRERSFELTVHFDPREIDAVLDRLGATAWTGERREVAVALVIDDGNSTYLLTRTSEKGYGQRLALDDEARALGLPLLLPQTALPGEDPETVLARVGAGAPARLNGHMDITPAGYWNTAWRFRSGGVDERFSTDGATFDSAIAEALRRSAKALAKR